MLLNKIHAFPFRQTKRKFSLQLFLNLAAFSRVFHERFKVRGTRQTKLWGGILSHSFVPNSVRPKRLTLVESLLPLFRYRIFSRFGPSNYDQNVNAWVKFFRFIFGSKHTRSWYALSKNLSSISPHTGYNLGHSVHRPGDPPDCIRPCLLRSQNHGESFHQPRCLSLERKQ